MKIVNPKFPEICQSGSMCKNSLILLCNWSGLDAKCNNLHFGDPNLMILVVEETLEQYIQMSRRNHYQIMELRPLKLGITVGNRVSWAY